MGENYSPMIKGKNMEYILTNPLIVADNGIYNTISNQHNQKNNI